MRDKRIIRSKEFNPLDESVNEKEYSKPNFDRNESFYKDIPVPKFKKARFEEEEDAYEIIKKKRKK
jgi:hypothetical protein